MAEDLGIVSYEPLPTAQRPTQPLSADGQTTDVASPAPVGTGPLGIAKWEPLQPVEKPIIPMEADGVTDPASVRTTGGTAPAAPPRPLAIVSEEPLAPARAQAPGAAERGVAPVPAAAPVRPGPVVQPTGLSPAGAEALKKREGGFYAEPYEDAGGLAIGYGMQTWKGKKVTPDLRITQAEADAELERQVKEDKGAIVSRNLKVPVTQEQYDALVSVAWNLPARALGIIKKLNAGEPVALSDFQKFATDSGGQRNPGLEGRGAGEFAAFNTPAAAPPAAPPTIAPARVQSPADANRGEAPGALNAPKPAIVPGNIDLYAQPKVKNADGSVSTVDTISVGTDKGEVLIPRVTPDGRHLTSEQAIAEYRKTGKHLGIFPDVASADAYAEQLHNDYAAGKYDQKPAKGFFNPKTGEQLYPKPLGETNQPADLLYSGVKQIAKGLGDKYEQAKALPQDGRTYLNPKIGDGRQVSSVGTPEHDAAISDIIEGTFKAATPLIAAGALAEPAAVAGGIVKAVLADQIGQKAAEAMGATPEGKRLVGNVAALLSGYVTADKVVDQMRANVGAGLRTIALAGQLSGRAMPEAPSTGLEALRPGAHAPYAETVMGPHETTASDLHAPGETLGDVVRTTLAPEPPELKLGEGRDRSVPQTSAGEPAKPAPPLTIAKFEPTTVTADQLRELLPGIEPKEAEARGWVRQDEHGGYRFLENLPERVRNNIAARAEAVQQPPAYTDKAAIESGRLAERRVRPGVSPTGEERREEPPPAIDVTPAEPEEHTFGSTQVNLPAPTAKAVVDFAQSIPDTKIAADGRAGDTEGTAPHVTVKYGLHTDDVDEVRRALTGVTPVTVTLGKTSLFTTDKADVLKVDVDSPALHALNATIAAALKTTDTHPTYVPHVTVAYLKPGEGKAYAGDNRFEGHQVTLDTVRFSTKDGQVFDIPLAGETPAAPHKPGVSYAAFSKDNIRAEISVDETGAWTHRVYVGRQLVAEGSAGDSREEAVQAAKKAFDYTVAVQDQRAKVPKRLGGTMPEINRDERWKAVRRAASRLKVDISQVDQPEEAEALVAEAQAKFNARLSNPRGKKDIEGIPPKIKNPRSWNEGFIQGLKALRGSDGKWYWVDVRQPDFREIYEGSDLKPVRHFYPGSGFYRDDIPGVTFSATYERMGNGQLTPTSPTEEEWNAARSGGGPTFGERLKALEEGRKVGADAGAEAGERDLAGGGPAGASESGAPARGTGTEGPERVAGGEPSAEGGVSEQPAESARRRKARTRTSGGSARRPAPSESTGTDAGTGGGSDGASHVDTADLADTQAIADAHARGEAPRWHTITDATQITEGGWASKLDDNLAALKLLKLLVREGRPASDAEQAVLARYIGWGHTELAPVVDLLGGDRLADPRKKQARQELEAILTADELKSLGESTANAHYSFADLPRAMWDLVERLGFQGGSILEPAVGTGHFLGTMPGPIRAARRTVVYGVDKEPIAAGIAQQLYQGANIQATPLEEAVLPERYFDLVISNVPFGKIGIFDPAFISPDKVTMTRSIHNYYFGKALDLARPGGLVVFVTSRYTMDAKTDVVRQYVAQRARFLGAIRLPEQAFRKTAGTDVVTDVIVLQKHADGLPRYSAPAWLESVVRDDLGARYDNRTGQESKVSTNEYFVAHPEMVLGKEARSGSTKGQTGIGYNVEGALTREQLAGAVAQLPAALYKAATSAPRKVASPAQRDAKQGSYVIEHGKLYVYDKATLTPSPLKGVSLARAKAFVPLRDAYHDVLTQLIAHASDADLATAQKALKAAYDAFVKAHGHVNARENKRVIDDDPNASRVLALENVEIVKGAKGRPAQIIVTGLADIFSKRLMAPAAEPTTAENPADALSASIAWKGGVDLAYMESLTGQPATALTQALGDAIFQDPSTQAWVTRAEYLSGDVVTKWAQAKAAAQQTPRYASNAAALEAVQPKRITIDDFTGDPSMARQAPFGATWVPVPLVQRFLNETGGRDIHVRLLNTKTKVEWYVEGYGRSEFLQSGYDYPTWVREALNGDVPTIYQSHPDGSKSIDPKATEAYRQSLGQLKEQWATWWKSDADAADELVQIYNALFNRDVPRTFDGSKLVTPNSNPEIVLRDGQKNSIEGALQRGNTLLAQAVGWGKTYEMIAIAGEWKRRGLARKPLIVVPNHIVEQWRRDFLKFYPAARVLLPEKRDFEAGNRKRMVARIANNEWDAVVIGLSQFLKVGVKLETLRAFVKEQEDQLLAEGAAELGMTVERFSEVVDAYGNEEKDAKRIIGGRGVPRSVKDVARAILNLRKRLRRRTDQQAKDPINFEELGIDGLIVDEAHMFKNLYFYTGKNDIVGLKGSDADQALDMFLKVRHINRTSNNRNVVFASGTPITNTMSELYTVFRYLAQPDLDRMGMAGFDSWANNYATAVGTMEPRPEGGYKERTRLSEWTNLKELSRLFKRFADVITTEDILKENARLEALGLPPLLKLPKANKVTIELEPHPEMEEFMASLRDRIEEMKTGNVDPKDDNHLKVTTDASNAAIDLRLVMPKATDDPNGRLHVAAREIAKRYRESNDVQGSQIVFLDVGVPKKKDLEPLPASIAGPALTVSEAATEPDEDDLEAVAEAEQEAELDVYRNLGADKNLYGELKRLIVKEGVPADQVLFIHQARNPSEMNRLFEAVRDGRVRVLFTTRSKGGTGMNVQTRVVAGHHIDVPWRPDQVEQADGRYIRQGNLNPAVDIARYVTKKSFDEYRWFQLAKKQGFISSFYRGELGSMEDIDLTQLDMQVASAIASGDPRTLQMIQAERALTGLRARYENFARRRSQAERDLKQAQHAIAAFEKMLPKLRTLEREAREWAEQPTLQIHAAAGHGWGLRSVKPVAFDLKDTDSRKALAGALAPIMDVLHVENQPIGTAGPFTIVRDATQTEGRYVEHGGKVVRHEGRAVSILSIRVTADLGEGELGTVVGSTPIWDPEASEKPNLVVSLSARLGPGWASTQIDSATRRMADWTREAESAERILTKQFEQTPELEAKTKELHGLRLALGLEKAEAAAEPTTNPAGGTTAAEEETSESDHEMRAPAATDDELRAPKSVAAAAATLQAAHADVVATLTAPNVSQSARVSSRFLRYRIAQMVHTVDYARNALRPYRNAVEKLTVDHAAILDLADALENPTGTGKRLPMELRPWLKIRTEVFDYLKKQIADLGIEKEWKDYYLGHVWETEFKAGESNPSIVARLIGRRPLQGPKSFLKKRSIPTMRDGVEKFKKEPKTWNLVEIDLYKMQEMAKFILGRQALEDNKRMGTWVFRTALKKAPDGMVPIPDPIGQVWAPPEITVSEAYDKLLLEGLENFVRGLGVKYKRETRTGEAPWGGSNKKTGDITMRVGAPEFALMHEIGHTLDLQYGLYDRIATALKSPEFPGDKSALRELHALAELRYQGVNPDAHFKKYVQKHTEQIANLVHAYLYAPTEARRVAPRAYDALDELVLTEPGLEPLADLQQMRSLVLGTRDATQKLAGPVLLGRYYAAPEVVRIFKNYLTPGLNANRAWALARIPSNALVQAKLALSFFHGFTVTQESAAMEAARGITAVMRGHPIRGAARFVKSLIEPAAVVVRGRRTRAEFLGTLDPLSLAADSATNLLLAGGGRVQQSHEYTNRSIQKFADHLRRLNGAFMRGQVGRAGAESLGAALQILPALVEATAYPILGYLVPAAKAGAAVEQIRSELRDLPGVPTEATLLAIASKAVNITDATLGEVIWDNYFLPRALMSAIHMVIMAPGWRGGSAVLLGRGLTDPLRRMRGAGRETYTVAVGGSGGGAGTGPSGGPAGASPSAPTTPPTLQKVKERYWSPYTSLMIATVLIQVLVSEIYQRAHGAGDVQSAKDVAFPRTGLLDEQGKPERVRLPGYAGIFYDILRDVPASVIEYALGGSAPLPTAIGQIWNNETVFGVEIVDKTDPWREQLADYVKFLEQQLAPISVSSYGRRAGTVAEKAESVAGISPAPARVTRTDLEAYLHDIMPATRRTEDQEARGEIRRKIREAVRTGNTTELADAVGKQELTTAELRATLLSATRSGLASQFQSTTLKQALHAFEIATPEERMALIRPFMMKALLLEIVPDPDERQKLWDRFRDAMNLPLKNEPEKAGATVP